MRILLSLLLLLVPGLASAQLVTVTLPSIRFEQPPPLVVVQSGVRVVEDYDDDLYVVNGRYWVRRDNHWYRAHDHRGGWKRVEHRYVPASLVRMSPGKYRRWKRGGPPSHVVHARDGHHDRHHDHGKKHKKHKKHRD